jgi:hypothetical protein
MFSPLGLSNSFGLLDALALPLQQVSGNIVEETAR